MQNPKVRAAVLMASPEDVEAQFYEAMREGDLDRLMDVWADDDDIVCVHPAGARYIGQHAIRTAFENLFSNGSLRMQPERAKRLLSMGCAIHSVLERVEIVTAEGARSGWVVSTNVYVKTAQGWRMAAHHASPAAADEPNDSNEMPAVLH